MKKVSFFNTVSLRTPNKQLSIEQVNQIIASDELLQSTNQMNSILNANNYEKTSEFKKLKEQLPAVTFAGEFSVRNNQSLVNHSEHIVIDIDGLKSDIEVNNVREKLIQLNDVVLLYISPSQRGIKAIHKLKYDDTLSAKEFHHQAFQNLEKRYKSDFDIQIDKSGKDLARLSFLCHDPKVHYNANAEPYEFKVFEKSTLPIKKIAKGEVRKKEIKPDDLTIFILDDILNYLKKNDLSITKDYDCWMRLGFALKNELNEPLALEYYFKYSKLDDNYDKNKALSQFNNGDNNSPNPVGLGSIIHMAFQVNYKYPKLNRAKIFNLNCKMAEGILSEKGIQIRYNEFKSYREIKYNNDNWKRFLDLDLAYIYIKVLNGLFKKTECDDWLYTIAIDNKYHPFEKLINGLSDYDGGDYIGEIANTIKSKDSKMTLLFLKKWLIGMVASLMNKNQYNENVIVLVGNQNIGKTRWVKKLLPPNFTDYISTRNLDPNNKDDLLMLSQYAIVLMDELSTILTRKASTEAFKAMTSLDKISIRKAYGREITEYPRHASIIGTSNEDEYLKDFTGNRRFFTIDVTSIDSNHEIDMNKVLSHAYHLYKNGEPWYLNEEEFNEVKVHNSKFEATNPYVDLIMKYCQPSSEHDLLTSSELIDKINFHLSRENESNYNLIDSKFSQQIGRILKSMGYKQNIKNISGKSKRLYGIHFSASGFEVEPETKTTPLV